MHMHPGFRLIDMNDFCKRNANLIQKKSYNSKSRILEVRIDFSVNIEDGDYGL